MRKVLSVIGVFILLLSFTSAYNAQKIDSKINSFAPNILISDNDSSFTLSKLRGKFVLLSFWSSTDAESRIRNIMSYKTSVDMNNKNLVFASVNYDSNKSLFDEIIKIDNVDKSSQFFDKDGINSETYKQFHLEDGFKSYLINREGKIVAVNPSMDNLTKLLSQ